MPGILRPGMVRRTHGGVPAFSPTDIAGLSAWYKADALGLANNDPVGTWTDSSGNGKDATEASTKPTYKTAIQNGLAVVRFDGVDDKLFASTLSVSQPGTVLMTAKHSNPGSAAFTEFVDGGDGTHRWIIGTSSTGADYQFYAGTSIDGGTPDTSWHQLTGVFNGASSSLRVDQALVLGVGNAGSQNLTSGMRIGTEQGGTGQYLTGDVGEILVYNTALGTTDRDAAEAYLKSKWATP